MAEFFVGGSVRKPPARPLGAARCFSGILLCGGRCPDTANVPDLYVLSGFKHSLTFHCFIDGSSLIFFAV